MAGLVLQFLLGDVDFNDHYGLGLITSLDDPNAFLAGFYEGQQVNFLFSSAAGYNQLDVYAAAGSNQQDADAPAAPVAEPSTLALFGTALAGLAVAVRRRQAAGPRFI
jgi:hypothetical protein